MTSKPMDEKPKEESDFKDRFVWKWHPHGWLTAILILVVILLLIAFAS